MTVDGLPVTTVLQTAQDLADDASVDDDHLAAVVRDAYGHRNATNRSLADAPHIGTEDE